MKYSPGSVEWFDQGRFRECGVTATRWPEADPHGYRPFVCVSATKDGGVWLALTRTGRRASGIDRLPVPARDKFGTDQSWHTAETFLDDSAFVYTIPWKSLAAVLSPNSRGTAGIRLDRVRLIVDDMNRPEQVARRDGEIQVHSARGR